LTHKIKHLEGRGFGSHPNPNLFAGESSWQGEGREKALEKIWREERKPRSPEIDERTVAAALRARRRRARLGRERERKRKTSRETPWARALCARRGVTGRS